MQASSWPCNCTCSPALQSTCFHDQHCGKSAQATLATMASQNLFATSGARKSKQPPTSFPSNAAHAVSRVEEAYAADPSAHLAAVITTSDSAVSVIKTDMVSIHKYIQVYMRPEFDMCMLTCGPSLAIGHPFSVSALSSCSQLSNCSAQPHLHESLLGECMCGY